jgi:hypothetical protein
MIIIMIIIIIIIIWVFRMLFLFVLLFSVQDVGISQHHQIIKSPQYLSNSIQHHKTPNPPNKNK